MRKKVNKTRAALKGPGGTFLLELPLSNRCNLACDYCSSGFVLGGAPKIFTFEQLKKAVDLYEACLRRTGRLADGLVSFTANEPLVDFPMLERVVRYVRSRRLAMRLDTNGTLLDPEKARFLLANGVRVFLSLDGCRRVHDRHRRFPDSRPSYDLIVRNLRRLPRELLGPGGLCVWAVQTPETIKYLPESMASFRRLGVGTVVLCLETYGRWNRAALARLRLALRQVKAGFPHEGGTRFLLGLSEAEDLRGIVGQAVSLSFDGRFYPCDFALIPPFDGRLSVGDLESGLRPERLDKVLRLAMFRRLAACRTPAGLRAPVERYYWGLAKGYSAARLAADLEDTSRVNELFNAEMGGYLRLQAAWERLSADRAFGDLDHRPKYAASKEMRRLRLAVDAASAPADLRAAVDFLLYSSGRDKRLLLAAAPGAGWKADGIRAYALLKAGRLGKRLRVGTEV